VPELVQGQSGAAGVVQLGSVDVPVPSTGGCAERTQQFP